MKIIPIKYKNVSPTGMLPNGGGAVVETGIVRMGNMSNGLIPWILILQPRTEDGIVQGLRVEFDNIDEMETFKCNRAMELPIVSPIKLK